MSNDSMPAKVRLTDGLGPALEDAAYDCLSALAGVDTYDTNLRDHPKAWDALGNFENAVRDTEQARCVAQLSALGYERAVNALRRLA